MQKTLVLFLGCFQMLIALLGAVSSVAINYGGSVWMGAVFTVAFFLSGLYLLRTGYNQNKISSQPLVKTLANAFVIVPVVIVLGMSVIVAWLRFGQFYATAPSREFYALVSASNREQLDLSALKSVTWDELTFLTPYGDACSLEISGLEPGSTSCFESEDDGDCELLLLRQNRLVARIPVNRMKVDLTTIEFPKRIPREDAKFRFLEKGEFPKMVIAK